MAQTKLEYMEAAEAWHGPAHTAALAGDYDSANTYFSQAMIAVGGLPEPQERLPLGRKVQAAHIARDWGFMLVRRAVAGGGRDTFAAGKSLLEKSVATTGLDAGATVFQYAPAVFKPHELRAVRTEHGATIAVLARAMTAGEVVFPPEAGRKGADEVDADDGPGVVEVTPPEEMYEEAHELLRHGCNGYYLVSNCMNAARQERLRRHRIRTGMWICRAAVGLAWTAAANPGNFGQASRTALRRGWHLRNYEAALESVRTAP